MQVMFRQIQREPTANHSCGYGRIACLELRDGLIDRDNRKGEYSRYTRARRCSIAE